MYSITLALVLAFCILNFTLVDAGVYVLKPSARSICHGGQDCTIDWLDDGSKPLLSAIGVCRLGLFTGKQQLVQAIPPVDISNAHSVTFKPIPAAGPNSNAYYIGIISTSLKDNSSTPYMAFSPFFSIDQMTGSFDRPLPEATTAIPIPSSLSHPPSATSRSTTVLSTITVGTLPTSVRFTTSRSTTISSTSTPPPTPRPLSSSTSPISSPSSTKLTTSILPSSLPTSTTVGTSAPASTSSNGSLCRSPRQIIPLPALAVLLLLPLLSLL